MLSLVLEYSRWVEAFHVISVIAWMAGMLYLPRLFVYHTGVKPGSESDSMLSVMERRLFLYIMSPAMVASLLLGITLAVVGEHYVFLWFKIKAILIIALLSIHALLAKHRIDFARSVRGCSATYFKVLGETVTLLMAAIVILVVVKPFR